MTKVTTEQDLYIKIKEAFNSASWEFREIPDKKVIEAEFEAHHAKVPLHAQSFEELMAISVVSSLSFSILPKSMRSALDALMRTNITLNLGNFEANPVSGEVYFRITNVFPDYNFKIVGLKRPEFINYKPVNVQFMGRKSPEELVFEIEQLVYHSCHNDRLQKVLTEFESGINSSAYSLIHFT